MKVTEFEAIIRALNGRHVRYLVAGGMAVAAHGYGRLTYDLDLVVQLTPANAKTALAALREIGYSPKVPITAEQFADRAVREGWIRDKHMRVLNLWSDRFRDTPVDIFVTEPFDFDTEYDRAWVQEIASQPVRFVSLETLIRMKESAGRSQDLADIAELRRLQERT